MVGGGTAGLSTGPYAGGAGAHAPSSDREYCCLLWDVEHQSSSAADSQLASSSSSSGGSSSWSMRRASVPASARATPLHKLSHQMGVASLAWLMDGNVLACGGQLRSLQLYDLRGAGGGPAGSAVAAPVSVSYAHNFAVHVSAGSDPTRPWLLASFCRSPSEPVKIWDCRRMDSASGPVSEIKIRSGDYASYVSAVQWSPMESGRLVVATGNTFHEYDVLSSSGSVGGNFATGTGSSSASSALRSIPIQTLYAKDLIADFCLPGFDKRIMAVSPGGNPSVFDMVRRHTCSAVVAIC
jgi:WD40 repeat protein